MYQPMFFPLAMTLLSQVIVAPPLLCTPATSPSYQALVANHSATFHMNFNQRSTGKHANEALASVSMDWDNNNVNTLGGTAFVDGLLNFEIPFPGIQIRDHLILNEGNKAALFYYFQGTQNATFMGVPASHTKVEILNGELMVFDQDALLNRLISINEIDRIVMEIKGQIQVEKFTSVPLLNNPQTPVAYRNKIKNVAAQFNEKFNAGKASANAQLVTTNVALNFDNLLSTGPAALVGHFSKYKSALPDLIAHDEYYIGDGHWAAVESILEGTRTGVFTASNGTKVAPDGKRYRTRVLRFLRFNDAGLVDTFWEVSDNDQFLTNVQG